jgi:hypothetical protein
MEPQDEPVGYEVWNRAAKAALEVLHRCTTDELRAAQRFVPTSTNCWYAIYELKPLLDFELQRFIDGKVKWGWDKNNAPSVELPSKRKIALEREHKHQREASDV